MNISPLQKILILESVITLTSFTFFFGTLIDRDGLLPIVIAGTWAIAWLVSTLIVLFVGFPKAREIQ